VYKQHNNQNTTMPSNFDDIKPKPPEPQPLKITLDTSELQEKIKPYNPLLSIIKGVIPMWQSIKNFIVAKIVQWILKFGAGVLVALGISNSTVEEIVAGLVSLIAGIIYSLITHKKIAFTDPKEFTTNNPSEQRPQNRK